MSQESSPFNNRNLFSNHYLERLIQTNPEWSQDEGLEEAFSKIRDLYHKKARLLETYIESDLEHNFIRPIFDILGHNYGIQETVYGTSLKPDYAFFPSRDAYNDAYTKKDSKGFYDKAIAVGDAKAWSVKLDKFQKGRASYEMGNPSYQIDVYLRTTPPKWAVLTNGQCWRLYHEDTSSKLDYYYEIDLPTLIRRVEETGDIQIFKYFYHFFRLESFPKTPLGESFLDRVREGSIAYAKQIGDDLQDNIYRAMGVLAEGFLKEPSNGLDISGLDTKDIQDNSLRFLYRLLFIFYAESRGLLDVSNAHYKQLSLHKLKTEIADRLDNREKYLKVKFGLWTHLSDLFRLINDGSESQGIDSSEFYIPPYNGGLFDPDKNPFLAEKQVGDFYLARAIDLLSRSSSGESGKGFVDYSSLEIRHLGSIYEGILEYRLKIAEEDMATIKEKGREIWVPKAQLGTRKALAEAKAGEVYLVTDKGERKATGSYYTPDYIVKYIVKNTLGPLIEPMMEEGMWSKESRASLLKRLLSLKVLDPAMGSGHFLVEATDYIAREIIHAREIARPEELESEEVAEHDIHWARREVVRNCIYGVDLNPMAVELAKLSLWLTTVASNKPLSFLDHHLRCGNSLIGAKLDSLMVLPSSKRDPDQLPMWQFVLKQQKEHTEDLLRQYGEMAALADDDLKTIKWKEEKYRELRDSELSRRLEELANVWLSTYFGNEVEEEYYEELQNHLSPNRSLDWSRFREFEWFRRAQELAQEKRFFHWELEFPEAFSGKENPGFDVVIGNPPYVRQEKLGEDKKYFEAKYKTYHSIADLYVYFIERGVSLLNGDGIFSYIVANKWMRANYGEPLREWMKTLRILEVVDFGDLPVFETATTYPCILTISSGETKPNFNVTQVETLDFNNLNEYVLKNRYEVSQSTLDDDGWALADKRTQKLLAKLNALGTPLGKYVDGKIYRGVLTGLNEAFVINVNTRNELIKEDRKSVELIKPFLEGKDIKRYEPTESGKYLILIPRGWTRAKFPSSNDHWLDFKEGYPAIANYLSPFAELAKKRYDKGEFWWELRACDYYDLFENPKIIVPSIIRTASYAFDNHGFYSNDKTTIIPITDLFLICILNSKVPDFVMHSISSTKRGNYFEYKPMYLQQLPIRRIQFNTPEPELARMIEELKSLYESGNFDQILSQVDACLPKDAQGNFLPEEKSDVVHDLLAFLAEQMLEMNKAKQKEIKGFLGWLESYVGAKADDLTPKTKIQSYYYYDFDELLAVLKKNKKKLKVDPSRREPAELLQAEFQASMGKLKPLMDRIERTDRLIDQVVYKLYGLTEEEIGIVEGKSIVEP